MADRQLQILAVLGILSLLPLLFPPAAFAFELGGSVRAALWFDCTVFRPNTNILHDAKSHTGLVCWLVSLPYQPAELVQYLQTS